MIKIDVLGNFTKHGFALNGNKGDLKNQPLEKTV